jgi:hypothetical protein
MITCSLSPKAGLVAAAAIALVMASAAFAGSPRFATATATINSDGDLRIKWNERGLETNQEVTYDTSANASAEYACQNSGGQFPDAPDTTKAGPTAVGAEVILNTGDGKNIRSSVTLAPPESSLKCPQGQTVTLVCSKYTQIRLKDTTNGVVKRLGEQSKNFFADDFPNACK